MSRREGYRRIRGTWRPSAAQRRVLDGVAAGRTNAEIAAELGLSTETVKWHVAQLLAESGCEDRETLAAWWQRRREQPALVPYLVITGRAAAVLVLAGLVLAGILTGLALHGASSLGAGNAEQAVMPPDSPGALAATPESPVPAASQSAPMASPKGTVKTIKLVAAVRPTLDELAPEIRTSIQQYAEDVGARYAGDCLASIAEGRLSDGDACANLELANDEQAIILLLQIGSAGSVQRVTFQPRDGRWLPFAVERIYPNPTLDGSGN
jgi:DNA-binding CsgD family transcriptional regulator